MQFYDDDAVLIESIARHLAPGAVSNEGLVLIATRAHVDFVEVRLAEMGIDVERITRAGQLEVHDADALLETFMIDGMPDAALFTEHVGAVIMRVARERGGVRAYGEMVDLLWQRGKRNAAIRVEQLLNDLGAGHAFGLLCAYRMKGFGRGAASPFAQVCLCHSDVTPAENYARDAASAGHMRAMAELQQRTRALEAELVARRSLEEHLLAADRKKNEFIAVLGHELRNPLSPILFALERMKGGDSHPREVDVIERQTRQIVRLVEDLLDVSRIAAGKVSLRIERCDLADLVARAVETASPQVIARQQQLTVDVPRAALFADQARLGQVVINLVHNASKYSAPNTRIEVRGALDRDDVVIRVKDEGRGIPPELLATMFDGFVQGTTPDLCGLGLGLTVAKNLVELHGGSISAHSEGPNKGAEIIVRLPRRGPRPH